MDNPTNSLVNHPLIRRLRWLDLNRDDFVIFGSGPLLAHRLRDQITDLDIVARDSAWERACKLGVPMVGHPLETPIIHFWGRRIEIFPEWRPKLIDTDELIDKAEVIADLRFALLENVLAYKRSLMRHKDINDINVLEKLLEPEGRAHNY